MPRIDQTLDIAIEHHQAGGLKQARQLYEEILRVDPQNVDALHLLGVALHQLGNHGSAIEKIRAALQLKPKSPVFLTNLAAVHTSAGDHPEAAAYCQEALQIEPDNLKAHYNLGCACLAQWKLEESAVCFQRVMSLKSCRAY